MVLHNLLWFVMLGSGLLEFHSAFAWWNHPETEWSRWSVIPTNPLAATGQGAEGLWEVFLPPWCTYLVTLGLVRLSLLFNSTNRSAAFFTALVHIPEQLIWWYWALKPGFNTDNSGVMDTAIDVLRFKRGFHALMVLFGPGLLCVACILLPLTAAGKQKAE